jgi:hypothetical protein
MVSLDQGKARIPMTITEGAGKVKLRLPSIGGAFDGTFNSDGSELSGEWQQGGPKVPLTFKRLAQATALHRPQEPTKPFPYAEEEAIVENTPARVKLAGTLSIPRGAGPHPAAVLITGSGPQDRDESLMGHRPFFILADHLAMHRIAVLRFDDAASVNRPGISPKLTTPISWTMASGRTMVTARPRQARRNHRAEARNR